MERRNHYRALLALQQIPEIGLRRIKLLLESTGVKDASELFALNSAELKKVDGFGDKVANYLLHFDGWKKADKILEKTIKAGAYLVAIDDENYPVYLKHIYDPPILLWVLGNREALKTDGIAVIGTRRPGTYGMEQASYWSERLASNGLSINSGLAYGIDAIAHKSALKVNGKTIAVLGSGIDVMYPAKNKPLAHQIIESGGAVITEYPPGTPPDAVNFPGRNRIVSGMSHGVLVVESGIKGGSMITARYALDQNREVFVVPHQLSYGRGEGCNYLIKTGQGKLVQQLDDILDELSVQGRTSSEKTEVPSAKRWESMELTGLSRKVCELLTGGELHIDQLSEQAEQASYQLLPVLLELEMQGAVRQKAGKYFELS